MWVWLVLASIIVFASIFHEKGIPEKTDGYALWRRKNDRYLNLNEMDYMEGFESRRGQYERLPYEVRLKYEEEAREEYIKEMRREKKGKIELSILLLVIALIVFIFE